MLLKKKEALTILSKLLSFKNFRYNSASIYFLQKWISELAK